MKPMMGVPRSLSLSQSPIVLVKNSRSRSNSTSQGSEHSTKLLTGAAPQEAHSFSTQANWSYVNIPKIIWPLSTSHR